MIIYTDIEIEEGLQRADSRILTWLWNEFAPRLRYYAYHMIRDQQEAEDIAAAAFEKLFASKIRFKTISALQSFLYITTRNKCVDFLRQKHRKLEVPLEYRADAYELPTVDEMERLGIKTELIHAIYKAMEELPGSCRQIFIMTYLEGKSSREIAEKLGITVSTVTTQRSRAIHYLRKVLPLREYITLMFLLGSIP